MKVTNAELFNAIEPFKELMRAKMPAKVSYEIIRLVKKLDEYLQPAETVKNDLIRRYGKEDPETLIPQVAPGDPGYKDFVEEYGELLKIEHDIDISVVILPGDTEIAAGALMALEKFVTV